MIERKLSLNLTGIFGITHYSFLNPAFGRGFTLVFDLFSYFDRLGAIVPNFACFRTFGRSVFAPPSEEIAKR